MLTSALRTRSSAPYIEFEHRLTSKISAISPFVDRFMRFVNPFMEKFVDANGSEPDESILDIELALREALGNAIIHGNREDRTKFVYVTCRCQTDGEVIISVRDEGQGFDPLTTPDPTDPGKRLLPYGRGIHVMRALMDEVRFAENGKVVQMRKMLARHSPNR